MPDTDHFAPLRFDSSTLPENEQYSTFASAMANFDMSRPGSGGFTARALVWRVGAIVVSQVTSDPVCYDRPIERVRADRTDHLYVNYHHKSRFRIDCGRGSKRGGAGSLLVIDTRQPCRFEVEGERTSVAIPRPLILRRLEGFDPHGLIARGGLATLLGPMLRTVCAALPKLASSRASAIERMVVDFIVDTLVEALRTAAARTAQQEALASRVRAYIDQHVAETLDVGSICRALGISRSSLYRAFGEDGGVLHQIQLRRLRRVQALLSDPGETRSIAALAQATGFADKSHLTRAFKKAVGITPGAFRQPRAVPKEPLSASDGDSGHRFSTWIRELD